MTLIELTGYMSAFDSLLSSAKKLADLVPKGSRKEEALHQIKMAEEMLARSDAKSALDLGYQICQCAFPPKITLREVSGAFVCRTCGHREEPISLTSDEPQGWDAL